MTPATSSPRPQEIDRRTIKLIIGVVAISLPILTSLSSGNQIESISASYYEGGLTNTLFIGCLFAISAFLMAYNGRSKYQMALAKVASIAGLAVALFPCDCNMGCEVIPYVHGIAASLMFLILAFFCYSFYERAMEKDHPRAHARAVIYAISGFMILGSIVVLGVDALTTQSLSRSLNCPRLIFWGETVGLVAFGIAWLTASKVLPVITLESERFSPLRDNNPE